MSTTKFQTRTQKAHFNLALGYAQFLNTLQSSEINIRQSGPLPSVEEAGKAFLIPFWKLLGVEMLSRNQAPPVFLHTASIAIDVAAKTLKAMGISQVRVITPTFDIIPDFLHKAGLEVEPIAEHRILSIINGKDTNEKSRSALFLVSPNNPTGFYVGGEQLRKLAEHCRKNNIILVIDNCFRAYAADAPANDVNILANSGCSFIAIYDTGKTISGIHKTGFIFSSPDMHDSVLEHANLFGRVHPLILEHLKQAGSNMLSHGGRDALIGNVKENLHRLIKSLEGSPLTLLPSASPLSAAWVKLPPGWQSMEFALTLFGKQDLAVLPGDSFFWDNYLPWAQNSRENSTVPHQCIRVSLARPTNDFKAAVSLLGNFAKKYNPTGVCCLPTPAPAA